MGDKKWPEWASEMVSLAALDKIIKRRRDLPDDELGSEKELIEALVAYQDAEEVLAAAAGRYRDAQRNWSRVRLPILKARLEESDAAKKTAETVAQPDQQQTTEG